ncbi:MAG: hypothetical protein A2Z25_22435 [Planctomycetes bacterium RBG_16_55_9]|nr:MAG: hypothetical protein A2Z25_22435 [Planctomycetes bacterium RBG_16_55_9]
MFRISDFVLRISALCGFGFVIAYSTVGGMRAVVLTDIIQFCVLAMPYVVRTLLPVGVRGVVIAGVISIVMSSADSFLNGAATCCINDLVKPLRGVPLSQRQELFLAKLINGLVGVLAVIFAVQIPSVLDILFYAYNFWAPIIVVPLGAVLLGFRVSRAGFLAGTAAGVVGALAWNHLLKAPAGISGLVIGVLCNLIAFILANKLRRS